MLCSSSSVRTEVAIWRFPSTQCGRARKGRVTGHVKICDRANIDPIWEFDPNSCHFVPISLGILRDRGPLSPPRRPRWGHFRRFSGGYTTPWFCDSVVVVASRETARGSESAVSNPSPHSAAPIKRADPRIVFDLSFHRLRGVHSLRRKKIATF